VTEAAGAALADDIRIVASSGHASATASSVAPIDRFIFIHSMIKRIETPAGFCLLEDVARALRQCCTSCSAHQ
jgi:hypothetical protein